MWPLLSKSSQLYADMKARDWLIPGTALYDPTNPQAADLYWSHLGSKLLDQGWDSFWLDGSEPELHLPTMAETNETLAGRRPGDRAGRALRQPLPAGPCGRGVGPLAGPARRQAGVHPVALVVRRRPALRRGLVVGRHPQRLPVFERQMAGGLNFALSGMPYWTTDIGGYYQGVLDNPPRGPDTRDPAFQELYVRWWQFGVFNPLFRTHGKRANNENDLFAYGDKQPILLEYDRLRYRLLPYIYALAWDVTDRSGTIMRPLVMDWRTRRSGLEHRRPVHVRPGLDGRRR